MVTGINVRVLFLLLFLSLGFMFYVGARTSPIIVFVFSVCLLSFLFAIYLTRWVLSKDEGPPEMVQVNFLFSPVLRFAFYLNLFISFLTVRSTIMIISFFLSCKNEYALLIFLS